MDKEFRQTRKPIQPSDIPTGGPMPAQKQDATNVDISQARPKEGVEVSGMMPPILQEALKRKAASRGNEPEDMQEEMPDLPIPATSAHYGPKLGFTGNNKLDELLAGIKETVHHYEEVVLPSRGKFYKDNVAPEDGIIHIRCMTGEEEAILATPRHVKKGQAINYIFRNCVRETIIPEKLLTIDRTWLLIYLRGISYSPEYEVELKCTECNGPKFTEKINLDTLSVSYCKDEFGPEDLVGTLPVSKYKFSYRLPTGKDENLVSEYREHKVRRLADQGADDTWLFRAALLINEIEGMSDKASLQTLVGRLPIGDVNHIRNIINDPPFGVKTEIDVLCPMCNESFLVDLPMETSFFFPKRKKENGTQV